MKLKFLIPLIAASLVLILVICFWFYKSYLRKQIQEIEITLPPTQTVPEKLSEKLPQNPFVTEREVSRKKKQYFYKVKYLGVSAGDVEVTVDPQKEKNQIVISANTKTSWTMSSLYTVEAELVTRIDAKSFLPLISTLSMVDTFSKRKRQTVFNYADKKIQYLEKGFRIKKGEYTKEGFKPLDTPFFDELSAFFLLESVKLTPNSTMTIPVVSNIRLYSVKVKLGELKDIELPNIGKLQALETTAEITKEAVASASFGDFRLFISPSYNNIPVMLIGKLETKKLKLGEIMVVLNEIK